RARRGRARGLRPGPARAPDGARGRGVGAHRSHLHRVPALAPRAGRRGDRRGVQRRARFQLRRRLGAVVDLPQYLRRLPKVDLHCHVEGTLRPATVASLARKHGITLPTEDVGEIYSYETIYEFLDIFRFVTSTV